MMMIKAANWTQVHRSVHAGEFGPSDVVFQAIERLGAERIVFGYSVSIIINTLIPHQQHLDVDFKIGCKTIHDVANALR